MKPVRATEHCRHYSYVRAADREKDGPHCACGIDLREKPGASAPCMPGGTFAASASPQQCAWREEYTDAEREAWEAWLLLRMQRMLEIMPLIPGSSDSKTRTCWGQTGAFNCPACKTGTVKWLRARTNGHIWASCSTPHCFGIQQ